MQLRSAGDSIRGSTPASRSESLSASEPTQALPLRSWAAKSARTQSAPDAKNSRALTRRGPGRPHETGHAPG